MDRRAQRALAAGRDAVAGVPALRMPVTTPMTITVTDKGGHPTASNGSPQWTYDAKNNAVQFDPLAFPQPGDRCRSATRSPATTSSRDGRRIAAPPGVRKGLGGSFVSGRRREPARMECLPEVGSGPPSSIFSIAVNFL